MVATLGRVRLGSRMFSPGKTRTPSREARTRLRWPETNGNFQDHQASINQMWNEIALGQRPCVCAISFDRSHRRRASVIVIADGAHREPE